MNTRRCRRAMSRTASSLTGWPKASIAGIIFGQGNVAKVSWTFMNRLRRRRLALELYSPLRLVVPSERSLTTEARGSC
jgi:hypothetical protein